MKTLTDTGTKIGGAYNFNEIIPKKYWSFSLSTLLVNKSKIKQNSENYNVGSSPQLGFEALVKHNYNFEKNYTLIWGIGGGIMANNFEYAIPKEMFDPPTESDISSNKALSREWNIFYIRIPLMLERKFIYSKKSLWNLNGGMSFLFSSQKEEEIIHSILFPNGQSETYLTIYKDNIDFLKPRINLHLSGGHDFILKSKHLLRIGVAAVYSVSNIMSANYRFSIGNNPEINGIYQVKGSNIGFFLEYPFYKKNKKNLLLK